MMIANKKKKVAKNNQTFHQARPKQKIEKKRANQYTNHNGCSLERGVYSTWGRLQGSDTVEKFCVHHCRYDCTSPQSQ